MARRLVSETFDIPSSLPERQLDSDMASEWDKERKFEIEKVSTVYLLTALCVVPFGVYFLLNFLSPLIHRITSMKISEACFALNKSYDLLTFEQIYVYPIKSLRGVKVNEALGTQHGFKHDRIYPRYVSRASYAN
jgi:hypothetical protein